MLPILAVFRILGFIICLTGMAFLEGKSQSTASTRTILLPEGDSVVMKLDFRFGWNKWEYSDNGTNWIKLNPIGNTLNYKPVLPVYIRTAVTNGTCNKQYSDVIHLIPFGLPYVSNLSVKNVTHSTLDFRGRITYDGNDSIADKGISYTRWNWVPIDTSRLSLGPGTGPFNTMLTGMNSNACYIIQAYATNRYGTALAKGDTVFTYLDTTSFSIGTMPAGSMNRTLLGPLMLKPEFMEHKTYSISLNSDGQIDFTIMVTTGSSPGGYLYRLTQLDLENSLVEVAASGYNAIRFKVGDRLSLDQAWRRGTTSFDLSYALSGWNEMTGYICFRKKTGGTYKYGWIKLGIENQIQVTLYEYAIMK
jgi:hypothetical protein